MGYNSLLFVLNDRLHNIDQDPKQFWENGRDARFAAMDCRPDREKDWYKIREREFDYQSQWVWNNHADNVGIIAVGYNMPVVIGTAHSVGNFAEEEGQVKILKQLADSLGYRLVKKK